ncbi:MAG: hypothetical protein SFU83_04085 [Meiothermus sp.]|nr:hypothetical protein [Meiothermus sp.]
MDSSLLNNPANPFTVWVYVVSYAVILGYLGFLLWRYMRESE